MEIIQQYAHNSFHFKQSAYMYNYAIEYIFANMIV